MRFGRKSTVRMNRITCRKGDWTGVMSCRIKLQVGPADCLRAFLFLLNCWVCKKWIALMVHLPILYGIDSFRRLQRDLNRLLMIDIHLLRRMRLTASKMEAHYPLKIIAIVCFSMRYRIHRSRVFRARDGNDDRSSSTGAFYFLVCDFFRVRSGCRNDIGMVAAIDVSGVPCDASEYVIYYDIFVFPD